MSSSKEVITLQFGQYANFVGTHWWNMLLEDLLAKKALAKSNANADDYETEPENFFHYCESDNNYVPRLVCVDIKDCIGGLSESGHVIVDANNSNDFKSTLRLWHGDVQVTERATHQPSSPSITKPSSPGKANEPKVWSDILKAKLHPKTLVLLPASAAALDDANIGNAIQNDESWAVNSRVVFEEIEDRIRYFSEACDCLEGFQILTTIHDGYSSTVSQLLTHLADDFDRKAAFIVPLSPARLPTTAKTEIAAVKRLISWAQFIPICWSESSLVAPMTLSADSLWQISDDSTSKMPGVLYNADSDYHTSALVASALDTLTLPYRLSQTAYSPRLGMHQLFSITSKYFKLNQTMLAVPYPPLLPSPQYATAASKSSSSSSSSSSAKPYWTSLTPSQNDNSNSLRRLSRCAVLRGLEPPVQALSSRRSFFSEMQRTFESTLDSSLPVVDSFVRTNCSLVAKPASVAVPYPQGIFPSGGGDRVAAALVTSGLHVGNFLDSLRESCQQISRSKYGTLLPETVEWSECLEWFIDKAQNAHSLK